MAGCVVCGGESQRLFDVAGHWIRQCHSCAHQFAEVPHVNGHVERVYGDDYFIGGARGYANYLNGERLLIERGRWYSRRMAKFGPPGTVLDVGAAAGFSLRAFQDAGWRGQGIEPNASMAEHARQKHGLNIANGSLETWSSDERFDLVVMLQVLAHFVDPRQAIAKASLLLNPGGRLLIETWNRGSWTARVWRQKWHEYNPPSVLHWFDKDGLNRLAGEEGFQRVASGRPPKWIDAGHAKSILRRQGRDSLTSRILLGSLWPIPDRVAIPYPAEDLFWILFRRPAN